MTNVICFQTFRETGELKTPDNLFFDETKLDAAITGGFEKYLIKYNGWIIYQSLIFDLCKDICIDALKAMSENERNSL